MVKDAAQALEQPPKARLLLVKIRHLLAEILRNGGVHPVVGLLRRQVLPVLLGKPREKELHGAVQEGAGLQGVKHMLFAGLERQPIAAEV